MHPSLPAKTFSEFVELARSQPGKFTFGTPGYGTGAHLASEQLWQKVGADLVQVPFKGTGPALTALLSKEVTIYVSTFASALPLIKQGRLRAYAVTSQKRAGPLPDVPTLEEEGVQGYDYSTWYGLFAPAGTPQIIVNMIHEAAVDSLKSPKLLKTFENEGLTATPTTAEEFAHYVASERRKWTDVMQVAKIDRR